MCIYFKKYVDDTNFFFYSLKINVLNIHFRKFYKIVMTFSTKNRHKMVFLLAFL